MEASCGTPLRGPGSLLERVSELAAGFGRSFATAFVAVIDPYRGEIRYAAAGHPPAAIVHPAGEVAFLDAAAPRSDDLPRMKAQVTGPLTLGVALMEAGMPVDLAFERARLCAQGWALNIQHMVASRLPATRLLLFLDEPALVRWTREE